MAAAFRSPDQHEAALRIGGSELDGFDRLRFDAIPVGPTRFRRRLETLFWHGLTALAFVAVVVLMFVHPVHAAPLAGTSRVVLAHPDGELPVGRAGLRKQA